MSHSSGFRLSATVVSNSQTPEGRKRTERTFEVTPDSVGGGGGGGAVGGAGQGGSDASLGGLSGLSHLSSMMKCVNRLETSLNQHLTQIIDDENEPNAEAVSALIAGDAPTSHTSALLGTSQSQPPPQQTYYPTTTAAIPPTSAQHLQQTSRQYNKSSNRSSSSSQPPDGYHHYESDGRRPTDGPKQKRCKNK